MITHSPRTSEGEHTPLIPGGANDGVSETTRTRVWATPSDLTAGLKPGTTMARNTMTNVPGDTQLRAGVTLFGNLLSNPGKEPYSAIAETLSKGRLLDNLIP